ncbi:hypothetical protein DL770_009077 [Monosporascus sp. CRB-9-2]|nr:hypothetical protein DL770_009077 [Monosporascus sp. CRB-9-2]
MLASTWFGNNGWSEDRTFAAAISGVRRILSYDLTGRATPNQKTPHYLDVKKEMERAKPRAVLEDEAASTKRPARYKADSEKRKVPKTYHAVSAQSPAASLESSPASSGTEDEPKTLEDAIARMITDSSRTQRQLDEFRAEKRDVQAKMKSAQELTTKFEQVKRFTVKLGALAGDGSNIGDPAKEKEALKGEVKALKVEIQKITAEKDKFKGKYDALKQELKQQQLESAEAELRSVRELMSRE